MSDRPDIAALTAPMPADRRAVGEAIATRHSVRGFLPTPIPRETVAAILALAARAPSGSNVQPWKVYVCTGPVREAVVTATLKAQAEEPEQHTSAYDYYLQTWREPYLARRRTTGWGLYGTLGIEKGNKAAIQRQVARNFEFFGAPVGLFFTLEHDMQKGAWLDCGMFIQTIMIAARGFGLDTCAQQAWASFHRVVKPILAIPVHEVLVCGMALGHSDPEAPANSFWTGREPVDSFTSFKGFDGA